MPGNAFTAALPPMAPQEIRISDVLKTHVRALAVDIGERNIRLRLAELNDAARYIEQHFQTLGYEVASQYFDADGTRVRNLEVVKKGTTVPDEIVVVGAHYDSALDTPGANDNGSGVAALLALADLLMEESHQRTLRFVAFVNEEPPYFQTDDMGSVHYANRCRKRNENIVAMLSLETMGYYLDEPKSQKFPPLVRAFYPDTGNFITFVGNVGSRSLVRQCVELFRKTTRFPAEGAAIIGAVPGIGWSDHWAFWEAGYDGVMVTDTAPFRYPHYHELDDTYDKIDYDRTARVVVGLARLLSFLLSAD
ncbi:MAG: M28 family peptidase [Proteobacteria bacterium]|nr:M28 family peptidase [Pseudomonadota bacterium]